MDNFWSLFWGFLWFFFLFAWLMLLFHIAADLFRDHETSGGVKALWIIFMIFVPFLGVLLYVIIRGKDMAARQMASQAEAQKQFDDYVKQTAGAKSPADQIASAKALLDQGAITQTEYEQMKAKALA